VANACAHRFAPAQRDFSTAVAAIQVRVGGRIGAYMLDTHSQLELAFNARERFAMCSTFKLMLVAAILKRVEAGALSLDGRLPVREQGQGAVRANHIEARRRRLDDRARSVRGRSDG
jgi:beta-lactamase class A